MIDATCVVLSSWPEGELWHKAEYSDIQAPAYYAQFFTYYAFEQCSKMLPIMLNIMPITTAIMPQFIYNYSIFNY